MPLPISTALSEAKPDSISELYSRSVEDMSDEDIDRIIADQRLHRERMERAEAAGVRPPREAKSPGRIKEERATPPTRNLNISELEI